MVRRSALLTLTAPKRIGERLHAIAHAELGGFEAIIGESEQIRVLKSVRRVSPWSMRRC